MNIFKILASGDGSINEPNVSAFLGYLLDPKADHGIHDQLIKRILFDLYLHNKTSSLANFLVDKNELCRNLSANSNFDVEVLLEQAFTNNETSKKQIVDIVILCFEKPIKKTESLAQIALSNSGKGELNQIFLIENKIKEGALREGQLIEQYSATVNALENVLQKPKETLYGLISVIFLSPFGERSIVEFEKLGAMYKIPSLHIFWNVEDEADKSSPSMVEYLKSILIEESRGDIESIDEYAKSTIKSFIQFVENDFKSVIEEELEGQTVRDIGYDFGEYKIKYQYILSNSSWSVVDLFQKEIKNLYNDIIVRHTKTHPVSVLLKNEGAGTKIFSLSRNSQGLFVIFYYRREHAVLKNSLLEISEKCNRIENVAAIVKEDLVQIRLNIVDVKLLLDLFSMQYKIIKNRKVV